jgi:heme/copper-type cytochrome/quinol oxidase subunit 2
MTLLIILLIVFAVVALMVFFGERYAKPMDKEQQQKYAKILPILVFIVLIGSLIKMLI